MAGRRDFIIAITLFALAALLHQSSHAPLYATESAIASSRRALVKPLDRGADRQAQFVEKLRRRAARQPLALSTPVPSARAQPPSSPCAAGCEERGNCNADLGHCECPPLVAGASCERSAVPACSAQWGFRLPAGPCQALAQELESDFPPTCECLAGCQAANLRVFYVRDCVNASQRPLPPGASIAHAACEMIEHRSKSLIVVRCAVADAFKDESWQRQAYTFRPAPKTKRSTVSQAPPPPASHVRLPARCTSLVVAPELRLDGRRSPAIVGGSLAAQSRAGRHAGARRRGEPIARPLFWSRAADTADAVAVR